MLRRVHVTTDEVLQVVYMDEDSVNFMANEVNIILELREVDEELLVDYEAARLAFLNAQRKLEDAYYA